MIRSAPRAMQGASLVTAIFLLVVLSGLAVAMVTLTTSQQVSAGLDAQGARAYLAARAGIEVGVFQVTRNNGPCKNTATVTDHIALPSSPGLTGFSVTVVCNRTLDAVTGQQRYTVQVTACNQPTSIGACPNPSDSIDYVQRVLHVEFSAPGEP